MDLKQLRIFAMIAETGSLSKTSDRMRLAQPALSRHVKLLESEIGHALFIRTGRGMQLTKVGSELLARISGPLSQLEKTIEDVRAFSENPAGQVNLGIIPSVSHLLAGRLAMRAAQELPEVTLNIVEGYGGHLVDWLHRGDIDAIVLYGPGTDFHLRVHDLFYEELCLVAPSSSDLPDTAVPFTATQDMTLILPSRPHGLRSLVEAAAEKAGIALTVKYEADSFPLLKELVRAGIGSTILPRSAFIREWPLDRLKIARLDKPKIIRRIVLGLPQGKRDTRATSAVIALMRQEIDLLIESGDLHALAGAQRPQAAAAEL